MVTDEERGSVIQEFYRGANILITGGTGFLGQVLVEKLLRSCPNLDCIYLLVRSKRGKDVETRLNELFEGPVFERLRSEQPGFRHKVIAVAGDCTEEALGLSPLDRQRLLDSVDMVFNLAATVRFDEHLRTAVNINVRATRDLMQLCKQCAHLKVFIHLSTAYSHCYRRHVEEVFYDPPMTAEDVFKLLECLDDDTLTKITPGLLSGWCNTYTFTKAIAEDLVRNSNIGCPVGIFKPSIVLSTAKEPLPGWIEKPFGPIGPFIGIAMGFVRVTETDPQAVTSFIPCDMSINAIIASAWDVHQRRRSGSEDIPLYNYVSTCENPITWNQSSIYVIKHSSKVPFDNALWVPYVWNCKYKLPYKFLLFFLHTLPALLMDIFSYFTGQESKMMKQYEKLHFYNDKTSYFRLHEWNFEDENVKKLWINISDEDKKIFNFNIRDVNWDEYFYNSMEGYRKFVLKQDPKDLPKAFKRRKRLERIHMATMFSVVALILWLIWYTVFPPFL